MFQKFNHYFVFDKWVGLAALLDLFAVGGTLADLLVNQVTDRDAGDVAGTLGQVLSKWESDFFSTWARRSDQANAQH